MPLTIRPVDPASPDFSGVVDGVDLTRPLGSADVKAIELGMERFAVLVFHDQRLDNDQQVAFTRNFGALESDADVRQGAQRRVGMEITDVSNLDEKKQVLGQDDRRRLFMLGNLLWHSDSAFKPIPAKFSILSARNIPPTGGDTEFADMRAAYDALDDETKALVENLVCEHSMIYAREVIGFVDFTEEERQRFVPVRQKLVRSHPVSGRKSLFLSSHAGGIVGWHVPEARSLLRELTEHATQPQFIYRHQWRPADLLMWDNRVTMHRGRRYDSKQVRELVRTSTRDSAPTVQQALAS